MYRELGRQQAFSSSPVIASSSSSSTHQLLLSLALTRFSFNAIISYFAPVPTGSVCATARRVVACPFPGPCFLLAPYANAERRRAQ